MKEAETVQAFTVTVDIHEFAKQTGERQWQWYRTLKGALLKVLGEMRIELAKTTDGAVLWSPGGDGGTLSVVRGGATTALQLAVRTTTELNNLFEASPPDRFDVRIGIDKGQVHIGLDLNDSPNVWGTAINNSHRIAATCAPGQVLASERFIEELTSQTTAMNEFIDATYLETRRPHKRLGKHGQFFSVVNIHHAQKRVGCLVCGNTPTYVADFEGPFAQMVSSYRNYLNEVVRAKSGIWTLLLARKLYDLHKIDRTELFNLYLAPVSYDGGHRDPNHPRDPFFSCFRAHALQEVMLRGRFKHLPRGEELCKVGDRGDALYTIAHGRLEIYDGSRGLVAVREPGSIVGEMALIEPGYLAVCVNNPKRTARMVAGKDEDVTLFEIPYDAMRDAIRSSSEVLAALVRSYSERQKENAIREAKCFQSLLPEEKEFLRIDGDLEGLRPGMEWIDDGEADCLIVCCHGRIMVERGKEVYVLRGQPGSSKGSVWLPLRTGVADRRISVKTETASEFLVWRRSNWSEWLQAIPTRNRRAFLAAACDAAL